MTTMTFDDAQRFLLDKLDAADADNLIRFMRNQEVQIQCLKHMVRLENNGWIRVDERLPELDCEIEFIVHQRNSEPLVHQGYLYEEENEKGWESNSAGYSYLFNEVTHWRESTLPPAPEQANV